MKALWDGAGRPMRFAAAGGWNTVFGVLTYAGLYHGTRPPGGPHLVHYLSVLVAANVVAVIQAYLCYKYLVFRTDANVAREFVRFAMVYAATFAFNLVSLPVLVKFAGMAPVPAQAIIVVVSAVVSYVGHSRFSFDPVEPAARGVGSSGIG